MAPHGWRKSPSVGAWLEAEGEHFDFFQAVALLENDAPDAASVASGPAPQREAVRLRSSIAMSFPPSDVERIARPAGKKPEITTSILGLAGALGPLPAPFAELVARRAANRDPTLRDFLDIFNHRLLSLFYRARKQRRIGLGVRSPIEDATAGHLFALIGLGTPGLLGRLGIPDRALLHHAGALARPVRPMAGLEVLLRAHFGVRVEGVPLTGRLCPIEREDRTAIGRSGRRRGLGRDAVIGERVWVQDAAFQIRVGPLTSEEVIRFLPGGDALAPLCSLTDVYVADGTDYTLCLLADPSAKKRARLGRSHGSRLGYTAWLGSSRARPAHPGRGEIHLSVSTLARFRGPPASAGARS